MFSWLWPVATGKTFLDVWTIFHLAFWLYMGSNFYSFKVPLATALAVGIVFSYLWEIFERYAEVKWPAIWTHPESWVNAYVSDPLTSVVGILVTWFLLNNYR
jgi:hypothetical protein